VSQGILTLVSDKIGVLFIVNFILIIAGMIADPLVSIMILTPVFLPVVNTVEIDLIHFGIIMVVNLAVGFVTPPMGMNLFVTSNLTGVPAMILAKKVMPFIVFFFFALVLINAIPGLSLLLIKR
jgi:C4-dicarboxylate transporter DctM subunit